MRYLLSASLTAIVLGSSFDEDDQQIIRVASGESDTLGNLPRISSLSNFRDFSHFMEWVVGNGADFRSETPIPYGSGGRSLQTPNRMGANDSPARNFSPLVHSTSESKTLESLICSFFEDPPTDVFTAAHVMGIQQLVQGDPNVDNCMHTVLMKVTQSQSTKQGVSLFSSPREAADILRCLNEVLDVAILNIDAEAPLRTVTPSEENAFEVIHALTAAGTLKDAIQVAMQRWFVISRKLRQLATESLVNPTEKKIFETSAWPPALSSNPSTFVPFHQAHALMGLSRYDDEYMVTEVPIDWTLYSGDYYVSAGPRLLGHVREVETLVSEYISNLAMKCAFPLTNIQLKGAAYLGNLLTAPASRIASLMPAVDVDPTPFVRSNKRRPLHPLKGKEILEILEAMRHHWPPTEEEAEKGLGVECLMLRIVALARFPDTTDVSSVLAFDNLGSLELFPEVARGSLALFDGCLTRTRHTDMVALPMMVYHLLSKEWSGFDYEVLGPLLEFYESNFNWVELDRAAKIRAATAIEKPNWWASWNNFRSNLLPSVSQLLRKLKETGNEQFDALVRLSLSSRDLVARFYAIDVSSLPVNSQPSVRAAVAILRMVVGSIRATGDFRIMNQWNYVINAMVSEYDSLMQKSSVDPAEVKALIERIQAVDQVAHFHPRASSDEEDAMRVEDLAHSLNDLFDAELKLKSAGMGAFFVHFLRNSEFDAHLAEISLQRFIANLKTRIPPANIEEDNNTNV